MAWWMAALSMAFAQDEPAWKRDGWGFGGLPAVNFNTDNGLGVGALGTLYRYDGTTSPYRIATTFLVFFTTRGTQNHRIDVDALKLAGGRLRLTTRAMLDVTRVNNFCGFGRDVTCDPAVAEAEADARGLVGAARDGFVRRYYLYSYVRPNLTLNARYRVGDLSRDAKTEVFGGYRAIYHTPGTLTTQEVDPGTLIDQAIDAGQREKGFLSVVQVGGMYDTRDFESAPNRGVWVEASVRAAHAVTGSQFDVFGYNLTGRFYVTLTPGLVYASRTALDGIWGDVPIREMAEMGGSVIYFFGGGLHAGRGLRERRLLGRVKGLTQHELRWTFVDTKGVDLTLLGFTGLLGVAEDHTQIEDFARPAATFGAGLRVAFGDNFIVRADVGFSQVEGFRPPVYLDINHLF